MKAGKKLKRLHRKLLRVNKKHVSLKEFATQSAAEGREIAKQWLQNKQ